MKIGLSTISVVLLLVFVASTTAHGAQWRAKVSDKDKQTASASRETLLELLTQLEALQTEVQSLRNQTEVQQNEINRLQSRLQDVTGDLDRRVSTIERQGGVGDGETDSSTGKTSKPAVVISGDEQKLYDEAFQLMKQGDHAAAARTFRAFVARYPASPLVSNAQYWLAESNYFVRNFRAALKDFLKVEELYPNSRKLPDAMLKIGYTYYELGEWAKARRYLQEVVSRYPGTRAANTAKARLRVMKKEGH